jgi:DNA-binding beta-propeller fold protein YncE
MLIHYCIYYVSSLIQFSLNTTTNTVVDTILAVGSDLSSIAYDLVNQRIYVINVCDSTLSIIKHCG